MAIFNIAVSPQTSLIYMTLGALIDVWTVVWYFAYGSRDGMTRETWFWVVGLFLTGLTLVILGVALRPRKQTVVAQPELQPVAAPMANPQAVAQQPSAAATDAYQTVPAPDAALTGAQVRAPVTPASPPSPPTAPSVAPTTAGGNRPGLGR